MNENIHDFLKTVRIEQQLSIQELSKLSGVSASHISRIERCNRKPSPQTLEKLAPHLNVTYMTLLEVANLVHKTSSERIHLDEVLNHPHLLFEGSDVSENVRQQITTILKNAKKD